MSIPHFLDIHSWTTKYFCTSKYFRLNKSFMSLLIKLQFPASHGGDCLREINFLFSLRCVPPALSQLRVTHSNNVPSHFHQELKMNQLMSLDKCFLFQFSYHNFNHKIDSSLTRITSKYDGTFSLTMNLINSLSLGWLFNIDSGCHPQLSITICWVLFTGLSDGQRWTETWRHPACTP